jgi:hypothetical protein
MFRRISLLIAVLLFALTVVSCGRDSTTISYTISGTVTASGSGLQGVIVTLSSADTKTFITDATGKFSFQVVSEGTYVITPTRTGYSFSPSTLTVHVAGANVKDQNFSVTENTALSCTYGHGQVPDGIQFYNYDGIFANDSIAAADATGSASLTWQAQFQNVTNFYQPGSYSGSLRTRLWAVPYSVSSGVFNSAYVIAEFYPHFTGPGAASSTQLYAGSISNIQITGSAAYNPPPGEYCIVATLEQYYGNSSTCSSPDHYCENDWWQSGNAWIFY